MRKVTTLHYEYLGFLQADRSRDPEGISRYLEESRPSKCPWHKGLFNNTSMEYYGAHEPSIYKYLMYLLGRRIKAEGGVGGPNSEQAEIIGSHLSQSNNTAKTCSGILNILSNSVLVKAPCDILISIDSDGTWSYVTPPGSAYVKLAEEHPPVQYTPARKEDAIFKNKQVIKFIMPITLRASEDYIHLAPQYHSDLPLTLLSGVIETASAPLNLITTFDIPPKGEVTEIVIKKGTVMAYLWTAKPLRLKEYTAKKGDHYMQPDSFISWAKSKK